MFSTTDATEAAYLSISSCTIHHLQHRHSSSSDSPYELPFSPYVHLFFYLFAIKLLFPKNVEKLQSDPMLAPYADLFIYLIHNIMYKCITYRHYIAMYVCTLYILYMHTLHLKTQNALV